MKKSSLSFTTTNSASTKMTRIKKNLFLGNMEAATDVILLESHGITHRNTYHWNADRVHKRETEFDSHQLNSQLLCEDKHWKI
jgi:hypothetical protein